MENDLLTSRKLEALSVVQAGTLASISYPGITHSFHLAKGIFYVFIYLFLKNTAVLTTGTNASLLAVRLARGQDETFCVNTD